MNMRATNFDEEIDMNDLLARLTVLEAEVKDIKTRITAHDVVFEDINDVKKVVGKIWGAIKYGAPSVIAACVAAGYVDGTMGRFLAAIFQ